MSSKEGARSTNGATKDARRSARLRSCSDSTSSQTSQDSPRVSVTSASYARKGPRSGIHLPDQRISSSSLSSDMESPEDGDVEDEEDDDESDDEEPDALAPSAALKKRGHQTGLSHSLTNTFLGKRGRSPGNEDLSERPTSKICKTDADAGSEDDDDAYNAVDDISESEQDDDVEDREERMIIDSEEDEAAGRPKRGSVSSMDSFFGFDDLPAGDLFNTGPQFFNEQMDSIDVLTNHTSGRAKQGSTASVGRRVRFAEEVQQHYASSTTTDGEDNEDDIVYPDIFLDQNSLDPSFRKLIEQKDDGSVSDGEGSYWDFENDGQRIEELDDDDDDSGSVSGSSGYETDEGETTDEEAIPPRTVNQAALRLNGGGATHSRAASTLSSTPIRMGNLAAMRRGPIMGSFLVDEDKPIAVVDGHGKHMLFYPAPKHRRRQAAQSVAESPAPAGSTLCNLHSEHEDDIGFGQTDPMLSSPANVMLAGMLSNRSSHGSSLAAEVVGPPEAFFPFTSVNSSGLIETDALDDETLFDDFSDEERLRIEDFIDFGDDGSGSSDDEKPEQTDDPDSNTTTVEDDNDPEKTPQPKNSLAISSMKLLQAPATPTPAATPGSLLEHFDRGVVSSFRRNIDRHKNWTRSPSDVAIKGGRLHAMNDPISPLRRRRGGSLSTSSNQSGRTMRSTTAAAATAAAMKHSLQHSQNFNGVFKKRIQNSNHMRRRKNTI